MSPTRIEERCVWTVFIWTSSECSYSFRCCRPSGLTMFEWLPFNWPGNLLTRLAQVRPRSDVSPDYVCRSPARDGPKATYVDRLQLLSDSTELLFYKCCNFEYCICSTINLLLLFILPVDWIHSGIVVVFDIHITAGY